MQKFVNLVDLVLSFPTSIHFQRFVSIQPRTSLFKFAKNRQKLEKKVRTIIGEDNFARVFDVATGEEIQKFQHGREVRKPGCDLAGTRLALGCGEKFPRVCDVAEQS